MVQSQLPIIYTWSFLWLLALEEDTVPVYLIPVYLPCFLLHWQRDPYLGETEMNHSVKMYTWRKEAGRRKDDKTDQVKDRKQSDRDT